MSILPQPSPSVASEEQIRDLLLRYRRGNWEGIQPIDVQERLVETYLTGDWTLPLRRVAGYLRLSAESRLLDLGCGVGSFVVACRKLGLQCFGVEPDRIGKGTELTAIQIARRRWEEPVFLAGTGENLPFPDGIFDLVTMNQVIEHVSDQAAVIQEAVRVLRPGGVLYVNCPNYLRFYEPHYKIFWLPLMPKSVGRLYLRLRGRSCVMLDQITYTTNHRVRSLLQSLGAGYTKVDLHRERFLRKREECSFAARSTRIISRLTHIALVGPAVLAFTLWLASVKQAGCEWIVIKSASAAN